MKKIWKYNLPLGDEVAILIKEGAKVLTAGEQLGSFMIWAEVDPAAPDIIRKFRIHGTGHPLREKHEKCIFINTVFCESLVFHIFDLGED